MLRTILTALALVACASPLLAQQGRFDVLVTGQWVNRIGGDDSRQLAPGETFRAEFETGSGLGFGLNYFFADQWSLEVKGAAFRSGLQLRGQGSDFSYVLDLGGANIFPVTALLQHHFKRRGSWEPYVGAGISYIIVQDVESDRLEQLGVERLEFGEQSGLVAAVGSSFWFADSWAVIGDLRYVPISSEAETRFVGTEPTSSDFEVTPLIVSAGIRYSF